ncbi:hypothetical protein H4R34_002931 [Dimargaris verticillata]|uniref:Uncharacterized protein n=1 Tax=Dimargaris verticillata TaxID=2761393 RepID=A0A9W8B359_9FUNG|nr:hypothetical protein H4R34_002931 [Dimargaris verticillata]
MLALWLTRGAAVARLARATSPWLTLPHIRCYSVRSASKTVSQRVNVKHADDRSLVKIFEVPGASTMRSMKTYALVFLACTGWFGPYIFLTAGDRRNSAYFATVASVIPLFMAHMSSRRLVTRLWLISEANGKVPRPVQQLFAARPLRTKPNAATKSSSTAAGSPPTPTPAPSVLYPNQLLAVETLSWLGQSQVYTVHIKDFQVTTPRFRFTRWKFVPKKDANGRRLPPHLYFHADMADKVAELGTLQHQIRAIHGQL